jgi:hypothetical protein
LDLLWVLTVLSMTAPTGLVARDEPYLAVRTGLRCSQCHVNRTGGGGRTDFGSVWAQTRLPTRRSRFVNRSVSDFFSLSANLRVLAAGTVNRQEETPRTTIEITEANLQLEARVVPDVLALYVDETVGPAGASTREAFALLESLPLNGYVKAGKFLLPYGLRLVDDAEFIRQRTGFNYDTPDQGVEMGIEPGPLSLFLSISNGTQGAGEIDSDKQVTGTAALVLPGLRVGSSASRNDGPSSRRDVVGGFAGFNVGRFAVLGEFDYVFDSFKSDVDPDVEQFVAYLEGDFLPTRGINLKVTYGFLDPNADIGENSRVRLRFGVEWFPIPFFQISTFYLLLDDIPQATTTNQDRLTLELHAYF